MIPLLKYIERVKNNEAKFESVLYGKTFEKYLVISCVSLIDKFMALQIRKAIDQQDIDISSIDSRSSFENMSKKYPGITKGECVSAQSDFTNPEVVNNIGTSLLKQDTRFEQLNMDFFYAVRKIDWYDPYKYVKGARTIFHNWKKFLEMFKLRKEIVHEMKYERQPYHGVASMCDNTMNFLDATAFIFLPHSRERVISRLASDRTLRWHRFYKLPK